MIRISASRQQLVEPIGRQQPFDIIGPIDRKHVGGRDSRSKRPQHFGDSPSDAAKTDNQHPGTGQIARWPANEFTFLLSAEKDRQAA